MTDKSLTTVQIAKIYFGPEISSAGSWQWLGNDLIAELSRFDAWEVHSFRDEFPQAELYVFIKWLPPLDVLRELAVRSRIVFCPVDVYGSAAEIDADWRRLRLCDRVVLHCPSLEKYFRGYSQTKCLDHHLKFTIPTRDTFLEHGPFLWTGVWANLPPLVEWINQHPLPEELIVLTNFDGHDLRTPSDFGFAPSIQVRIEEWSAERHAACLSQARAALDIKGDDFRQRHKPAAKALDFVASGIPLAMNGDSSGARYLKDLGFDLATPDDERWLTRDYWEQTRAFGLSICDRLSRTRIALHWHRLFEELLAEVEDEEATDE